MLNQIQTNIKRKKPTKLSPIKESKAVELMYYKALIGLVKAMEESVNSQLLPKLEEAKIIKDSALDIITVLESLRSRFTNIEAFANQVSSSVVNKINETNKNRFLNTANKAFGVDLTNVINENSLNEVVALQKQKNKVLIKSIPEEFFKEVEMIVSNGLTSGLRHEEIAIQLKGIKGITSTFGKLENRVKMIARNEVSSINANLNQARYENVGISIYEWQSSNDERTRPSHESLDGKICSYRDATVYADSIDEAAKGKWKKRSSIGAVEKNVGIDFNCRCVAVPIIEGIDYES